MQQPTLEATFQAAESSAHRPPYSLSAPYADKPSHLALKSSLYTEPFLIQYLNAYKIKTAKTRIIHVKKHPPHVHHFQLHSGHLT